MLTRLPQRDFDKAVTHLKVAKTLLESLGPETLACRRSIERAIAKMLPSAVPYLKASGPYVDITSRLVRQARRLGYPEVMLELSKAVAVLRDRSR